MNASRPNHTAVFNRRLKRLNNKTRPFEGFTRLELGALLAGVTLMFLVVVPLLAQGRPRSQLAVCLNNLRQVGQAMLTWNAQHGAADPWRVDVSDGGSRGHFSGAGNNLWFQFSWISNELRTPRILACPSDSAVIVATDFGYLSTNSFLHPERRNAAISYFLGLDALPDSPQHVLSADRHARLEPFTTSCSSGLTPVYAIDGKTTEWSQTNIHGSVGHILFHDGRVELRSTAGLRQAFAPAVADDNGSVHLLIPRPL
ncbi:MAG TPA: hypothetical protein VNU68_05985 [Verrucomicrobiae bacterium]|nr:hypothetical protein [Verrucomicrobiae bacterium]